MDAAEWDEKSWRVQAFCREQHLDGVWRTRAPNVGWLSGGGRTYFNNLGADAGAEVLTPPPGWPQVHVPSGGGTLERPDSLQIA